MSETRWNSRVHGLLRDAEGRVLVTDAGGQPRLPFVEVAGAADDELPDVIEAFATVIGAGVVVVRPVWRSPDEEKRVLELGLELEPRGSVTTPPPGTAWVSPHEVAALMLPTRDAELVEKLLADEPPPERPPWSRRGWFAEVTTWIDDALAERGRRTTAPVEQVSTWCISSILRAPTEQGHVFFKATARSPLFVDEGTVTLGLAQLFPEIVPRPLAIDSERRWMLLDDFGPLVGWDASLETRLEVVSLLGRMQAEASDRVDELIALGAIDRTLGWLATELGSLLRDSAALGLDDRELEQLAALVPAFVTACERLVESAVPDSLVHGDLHLNNVARGDDGRYVFFDWTDACVTHPFLDLLVVLLEEDSDLRMRLRDAYLSAWAEFAPESELRELWRLAAPLASLNQAISYRYIAANIEPGTGQELSSELTSWLRKAIGSAGGS